MAKVNLDLDFDGKTRLKDWWEPNVKNNFQTVQNTLNGNIDTENIKDSAVTTAKIADSAVTTAKIANANVTYAKLATDVTSKFTELQENIYEEESARAEADTKLQTNINSEATARTSADTTLQTNLNAETSARQSEDSSLQSQISAEVSARESADNALSTRVTAVEKTAHTHENKDVLDGITEERVTAWDENTDISAYKEYVNDIFYGIVNQFRDIYTAVGIQCYDGGLFGMEYEGGTLDGGAFGDTEIGTTVDGGGFGARDAHAAINEQISSLELSMQVMNSLLGTLNDELDELNGQEE